MGLIQRFHFLFHFPFHFSIMFAISFSIPVHLLVIPYINKVTYAFLKHSHSDVIVHGSMPTSYVRIHSSIRIII